MTPEEATKKRFEFLKGMFSEDNHNPSFMRGASGWTIFWFVLVLSFGFVWIVTNKGTDSLILGLAFMLMGAVLGVLGIKNSQKVKEQNMDDKDGPQP